MCRLSCHTCRWWGPGERGGGLDLRVSRLSISCIIRHSHLIEEPLPFGSLFVLETLLFGLLLLFMVSGMQGRDASQRRQIFVRAGNRIVSAGRSKYSIGGGGFHSRITEGSKCH